MSTEIIKTIFNESGGHRAVLLRSAAEPIVRYRIEMSRPSTGPDSKDGWSAISTSGLFATLADAERDAKAALCRIEETRYAGMTVNERLFDARLLDAFDEAVRRGDRDGMVQMLTRVDVDPKEAVDTADKIIARNRLD